MSYKSEFAANNTEIEANNAALDSLIEQANALPNVSGGVDTCTLVAGTMDSETTLYVSVVDETGAVTIQTILGADFDTVENVVCNNLLVADSPNKFLSNYSDAIVQLATVRSSTGQEIHVYRVTTEPGAIGTVSLIIMD